MKNRKYAMTILIAAVCVIVLGAMGIALIRQHSEKTMGRMEEANQRSAAVYDELTSLIESEHEQPDEMMEEGEIVFEEDVTENNLLFAWEGESESDLNGNVNRTQTDHQIIFVGDSRTVGTARAESKTGDACIYIGESGEGYDWFAQTGIFLMEEAIENYPDAPVVFNFGVNDPDNLSLYLLLYEQILLDYLETDFYFMSVNPVTEESTHIGNEEIEEFNEQLRTFSPNKYIDTYTWMTTVGFATVDGVHYTEEQYIAIHNYAVNAITGLSLPTEEVMSEANS